MYVCPLLMFGYTLEKVTAPVTKKPVLLSVPLTEITVTSISLMFVMSLVNCVPEVGKPSPGSEP